jgi:hypothetical protein
MNSFQPTCCSTSTWVVTILSGQLISIAKAGDDDAAKMTQKKICDLFTSTLLVIKSPASPEGTAGLASFSLRSIAEVQLPS